jgi:kynurenine formamidase
VTEGRSIRLDLPLTEPDPPLYGRKPLQHEIYASDRNNWDDRLDDFYPQASTQWDSLRHVRCREFGFWGGETGDPDTHDRLGIDNWATGIVGRGVLLDVDAHLRAQGQPLEPTVNTSLPADLLAEVAEAQGVERRAGDIVCVRTGWMGTYQGWSPQQREQLREQMSFPGLAADEAMSRYLWDTRVAAIVADNPAIEVSPGDPKVGSLHRRLIPLLGFALGELFLLDELRDALAAAGRWEFLFVGVPLYLPRGVGSPGNALALI